MKKKTFALGMIVLIGTLTLTGCVKEDKVNTSTGLSVVGYAASDKNLTILVEALTKANLIDILDAPGNFTVFAPTNDAFKTLFAQLGISGVADLSKEALTPILLYHVLGSEMKSNMLIAGYLSTLSSSQGNKMSLKIDVAGGVMINKTATVIKADIDVNNGVIHLIDKVLLPPTVVDLAMENDSFSILVQAVLKADLAETLSGAGPFTIFAPTNSAFNALFAQLGVSGISDLTAAQLVPILKYHVVSGNVLSGQLSNGSVQTLNGTINVTLSPVPAINGTAKIIATDIQGSNGVIHVIDKVLLPPSR
jgi:transforming growth factor-beta-induced protein